MTKQNIGEKRFREASGVLYMADGFTIRCQGISKSKLRILREEHEDYTSPADYFWPEAQCPKPAVPNMFVCHFHGGETPSSTPRTILDVLPIDLAEKMRILQENPDYLNRRVDINLMEARKWQLLEELQQGLGGDEAWDDVGEALAMLRRGEMVKAEDTLQKAIKGNKKREEVWNEVYHIENIMRDLTTTQVKTAKDLQQMATYEQVSGLIVGIQSAFEDAVRKYIDDPSIQSYITNYFVGRLFRLTNTSPATISGQLASGRTEEDGNALGVD